ncbi:MAG: hypothetical protein AB4050_14980 [Synechococcus sp.]
MVLVYLLNVLWSVGERRSGFETAFSFFFNGNMSTIDLDDYLFGRGLNIRQWEASGDALRAALPLDR